MPAYLFVLGILLTTIPKILVSQEILQVEGALQIGDSPVVTNQPGAIRYNPDSQDFEGFNGSIWLSLTGKIQTGSVNDVDGNVYQTRIIAGREWMIENLRTTRYKNSVAIPGIVSNTLWNTASSGAWCWYDNSNSHEPDYGKLYNWFAVTDNQGICPSGWAVPDESDWQHLADFLGGILAGGKWKETGFGHWNIPNTGATNLSGFKARPGGSRNPAGVFSELKLAGIFWSADQVSNDLAWNHNLRYDHALVNRSTVDKHFGLSVRCVKKDD